MKECSEVKGINFHLDILDKCCLDVELTEDKKTGNLNDLITISKQT